MIVIYFKVAIRFFASDMCSVVDWLNLGSISSLGAYPLFLL